MKHVKESAVARLEMAAKDPNLTLSNGIDKLLQKYLWGNRGMDVRSTNVDFNTPGQLSIEVVLKGDVSRGAMNDILTAMALIAKKYKLKNHDVKQYDDQFETTLVYYFKRPQEKAPALNRLDWERAVIDGVAEVLDCTNSDAQGVVETPDNAKILEACWTRKKSVKDTVSLLT